MSKCAKSKERTDLHLMLKNAKYVVMTLICGYSDTLFSVMTKEFGANQACDTSLGHLGRSGDLFRIFFPIYVYV